MHVSLPNELEKAIKDEVSGGFYSSVSEFMREAARQMLKQHGVEYQVKLQELRKAVAIGAEQAERGEFVDQDVIEIVAELKKEKYA